jgi:hypothetical protein
MEKHVIQKIQVKHDGEMVDVMIHVSQLMWIDQRVTQVIMDRD